MITKAERSRLWRIANKEKYRAGIKSWHERNKERVYGTQRSSHLRSKYGMTVNDYNHLFNLQGGMCFICKKHQSEMSKKLNIDHNHKSGKIRGLLCWRCNSIVGIYEKWGAKIAAYLQNY